MQHVACDEDGRWDLETAARARLVSVCSEHKLFGSIVTRIDPPTDTEADTNAADTEVADTEPAAMKAGAPATPTGFDLAEAEELLVAAMEQITAATPTASAVKSKMVTLDPTFDAVDCDGCRSIRDVLGKLGHRVRTVGRSGHDITLALIDPPDSAGRGAATAPTSDDAG